MVQGDPESKQRPSEMAPMLKDSNVIDIPIDWLYKGKRKTGKVVKTTKAVTVNGECNKGGGVGGMKATRSRSASISNGALSSASTSPVPPVLSNQRSSSTNGTISSPLESTGSAHTDINTNVGGSTQSQSQSHIGAAKVNNAGGSSSRKRSTSISSPDLKRSDSLGERSKKSLFGSLFGRRSSQSSPSAPSMVTASGTASAKDLPPIIPSYASTTTTNTTATMKEPSSPEVRPHTPATLSSPERMVLNKNPKKPSSTVPIQELSKICLKRVTFAVDKFQSDPPQQLPSRKPKLGNVLVPEDMISEVAPISVGITNSTTTGTGAGSGASPISPSTKEPLYTKDSKEYKKALEFYKQALKESVKHQQEAHYAAQRIEHEVLSFKVSQSLASAAQLSVKVSPPSEQDTKLDSKIANLSIDKPIHMHENHFGDQLANPIADQAEVTLDVVYTRCCHLREILPIPSTLRQVKGKTAPLHTLKFLNPKPTLIDILSFCDFISVVPINTIIFDKVTLSPEMFRIVLISLVNSQVLEKLSLRNVAIQQLSWTLLCKFLLMNKSITKLDISQTKMRPELEETCSRDNMDWSLFSQVLSKREGRSLEELLINGVRFNKLPVEQFQNLLNSLAERNPSTVIRLGLATSDISVDYLKVLLNWMSQYKVQGVDLAFNDLSGLIKPLVSKLSSLKYNNLEYFTLNSTNISSAYDLALVLKYLANLPQLKFLDLSNLPSTFPDVLPYLFKYLPRFPKLNRIHLDSNNLRNKDISMVCSILTKCKYLSHVSMISQAAASPASATTTPTSDQSVEETLRANQVAKNTLSATLYAFVKDSPNLVSLDVDYEDFSDEIKSRIALMLMRNMNKNIDSNFQIDEISTQDELLFDGSLITETAEDVLGKITDKDLMETDATKRYLTKKYFEKLQKVRHRVQSTIDDMFEKRSSGELPLVEKENLLRLLLLEKNLSNLLEIFSNIPHISQVIGPEISNSSGLPCLKHVGSNTTLSSPGTADNEAAVRPHLMATDSGRIIDVSTGKSLLFKTTSNTSMVSKRQEEEEGELHKWGFFVQQQRSLYPAHEARSSAERIAPRPAGVTTSSSSSSSSATGETKPSQPLLLPKIPSGTELREAIIKAKGIDSIDDLINNVNKEQVELESIYGRSLQSSGSPTDRSIDSKNSSSASTANSSTLFASAAISRDQDNTDETVKETYDKLLNNLKMERPTKTDVVPKKT